MLISILDLRHFTLQCEKQRAGAERSPRASDQLHEGTGRLCIFCTSPLSEMQGLYPTTVSQWFVTPQVEDH